MLAVGVPTDCSVPLDLLIEFLKSDLSVLPLPCCSHTASPLHLNILDTSSGCRGRDKSSGAAGGTEIKFTMGAVTMNYQTLCMQRPSILTQYFSRNLRTNLETLEVG